MNKTVMSANDLANTDKHKKSTINLMKNEAKAYNKHLTDTYLDKLSTRELLAQCHPNSRPVYTKSLNLLAI